MSTRQILEQFDGKVALVTGGAGLFGRQIVEAVAEAGARTFMASRGMAALEKQAAEFRGAGLDVTALALDQGDEESIKILLEEIIEAAGQVDILVNNAVLRPMKNWDSPASDFARSMEVNATGILMMTRIFGDQMAEQGSGSIINVASIQSMIGPDYTLYEGLGMTPPPDYYFHKGGMIQLTRYAACGPHHARLWCWQLPAQARYHPG